MNSNPIPLPEADVTVAIPAAQLDYSITLRTSHATSVPGAMMTRSLRTTTADYMAVMAVMVSPTVDLARMHLAPHPPTHVLDVVRLGDPKILATLDHSDMASHGTASAFDLRLATIYFPLTKDKARSSIWAAVVGEVVMVQRLSERIVGREARSVCLRSGPVMVAM